MALQDWLCGLRRGQLRGREPRSQSGRIAPFLSAEVRPLETRQMLSGMNTTPQLISIAGTVDPSEPTTTQAMGLFTDDVFTSGYLYLALTYSGNGVSLQNRSRSFELQRRMLYLRMGGTAAIFRQLHITKYSD